MARLHLYRTYGGSIDEKDPVIFKVKNVLQAEGFFSKKKRKILSQISNVAVSTFDGWFEGDTCNPRNRTVGATISALGYELDFKKVKTIDVDKELKAAADFLLRQNNVRGADKPVKKRVNSLPHRNGEAYRVKRGKSG